MASLGLEPDELKVLEQLRQRVSLLTNNIQSLRADINHANPLPPASSLHASHQILQGSLKSLAEALTENSELLQRIVVRPSSNFPGRTQEGILTQLLRKKPEPQVEEWASKGREVALAVDRQRQQQSQTQTGQDGGEDGLPREGAAGQGNGGGGGGLDQVRSFWQDVSDWTNQRLSRYVRDEAGSLFTAEEKALGIENVRTGLKRDLVAEEREREEKARSGDDDDLEEDEEDDDDDGNLDQDVVMDGMPAPGGVAATGALAAKRPAREPEDIFFGSIIFDRKPPRNTLPMDYLSAVPQRGPGGRGMAGMHGMMGRGVNMPTGMGRGVAGNLGRGRP